MMTLVKPNPYRILHSGQTKQSQAASGFNALKLVSIRKFCESEVRLKTTQEIPQQTQFHADKTGSLLTVAFEWIPKVKSLFFS